MMPLTISQSQDQKPKIFNLELNKTAKSSLLRHNNQRMFAVLCLIHDLNDDLKLSELIKINAFISSVIIHYMCMLIKTTV